MIKVKEFGSSLIFEQLGRISIAGVSMWVVALLEINKISESIAMITILIWMILPTTYVVKGLRVTAPRSNAWAQLMVI